MTEPLNEPEELEEVRDRPWRDRVVARSLGAATRQTLDRAQALIEATIQLLETSGESVTVQDVADKAGYSLRVLYRPVQQQGRSARGGAGEPTGDRR